MRMFATVIGMGMADLKVEMPGPADAGLQTSHPADQEQSCHQETNYHCEKEYQKALDSQLVMITLKNRRILPVSP